MNSLKNLKNFFNFSIKFPMLPPEKVEETTRGSQNGPCQQFYSVNPSFDRAIRQQSSLGQRCLA